MPHHNKAASGSPVLRIAAADIGEVRTSRVPALSVLLMQGQRCTVGFGAGVGAGVCVFRGFSEVVMLYLCLSMELSKHAFYKLVELAKTKQAEIMKSFLIHYKRYMLGFMIMITLHQIKDVET
ncbi:MAG: hypothetical protein Q8M95_10385 [Candidatus Methanoperedens sp.]|nr:hypothetical protein [Candidatus Methanoperedens sp.]